MMSIATFAPSLLLITGAHCAALWSAAWTSLDYKGRHAGNVAQSTAGLWRGNMCCECSSCVTSHHRTPAAAWTSRPMRGRLPSAAAIGLARWFLAGSWRPVLCREGEGAAAYQTKEYMPPSLACVWERGGGICTALCKTGFLLVYLGKILTNGDSVLLI